MLSEVVPVSNVNEEIFILDDCDELRVLVTHLLKVRHHQRCGSFSSYDEMISHQDTVLSSKIAVLDVNLGDELHSGIDAYRWLKNHNYKGKILFFTGHARSHPAVQMAWKSGSEVLEKPIAAKDLVDKLANTLKEVSRGHS